ncbi:MAG: anti-sigma factor family protein [Gaiellaceae bacterium]
MSAYGVDPCAECEEMMQPYLDRELSQAELEKAEAHLDTCSYCRRRYRFEISLRRYVRTATEATMPPELKQRLASLRTPLAP